MPYIALSELYPAMDEHPPRWVRSADGTTYEPDWSDYPEDAPRWQVSHIDPATGFTFLTLPNAETEADDDLQEVMADVDDREPDAETDADDAGDADVYPGATPDAA